MNITKNMSLVGRDSLNAKIKSLINQGLKKERYSDYDFEKYEDQVDLLKDIKDLKIKKEILSLLETKKIYAQLDSLIKKKLSNKNVLATAIWTRRIKNGNYTCNAIFTNTKTNTKKRVSNYKGTL